MTLAVAATSIRAAEPLATVEIVLAMLSSVPVWFSDHHNVKMSGVSCKVSNS